MVEVINYEKVNKGKTVGYVDIKLTINKPTTLILRRIRQIESNGKKWLAMPNFTQESSLNGELSNKYIKYYEFEIEDYNIKLLSGLKEKIAEFIEKNLSNESFSAITPENDNYIPF